MPRTALTFLVGAVAISGLPPLNGFVSEFLIYLGANRGMTAGAVAAAVSLLVAIAALALIGGLAAACFTKAFGVVFLGAPRSDHAKHAHESGLAMRLPMYVLAAGCVLVGLLGPWVVATMRPLLEQATGLPAAVIAEQLPVATAPLSLVVLASAGFVAALAALAVLRWRLLASRTIGESGTWDCGYAAPTPRMQYTASSFAQPLTELFSLVLRTRRRLAAPQGIFPREASLATETPDLCQNVLYAPSFRGVGRLLGKLRWLQHGRVQLYVLYDVLPILNPLLGLILAPLLLGVINRTKAFFAGRIGPPLLQPYYDVWKLLHKGTVYSRTTSWVFRAGPMVGLAAVGTALALVPLGGMPAPLAFAGDLVLFAYLPWRWEAGSASTPRGWCSFPLPQRCSWPPPCTASATWPARSTAGDRTWTKAGSSLTRQRRSSRVACCCSWRR